MVQIGYPVEETIWAMGEFINLQQAVQYFRSFSCNHTLKFLEILHLIARIFGLRINLQQ